MQFIGRLSVPQRETKVVGLICTGHFMSHFYLLLIPPLFPILRDAYGVGFTELGFATAGFSMASGLSQIPIGFLVDRYGARNLLIAALMLESAAFILISLFPLYGALVALMVTAGMANAVYHPADYAILVAAADRGHIGRVFSFHTFTGYFGDAVAPATVLFLASVLDWRAALFICGLCGAAVAVLMWMNSGILAEPSHAKHAPPADARPGGTNLRAGVAVLFSLPVLMGLLFFTTMTISSNGIKAFGVSVMHELYQMPLGTTGVVITAYLFASSVGVLASGFTADRIRRHDLVAAACVAVIALCIFAVAAFDPPPLGIGVLFGIAGFCIGYIAPARDMLIRSIAPPGNVGKVFGFVSVGFDIGGVTSPVIYGWVLDHSNPRNVFWTSGVMAVVTILTVLAAGREGRRT